MKLKQASLSVRKEQEGSFHHCEGPVRLVQTCLCVGTTLQSRVNRRAGDVKHVQPCLSTKKG